MVGVNSLQTGATRIADSVLANNAKSLATSTLAQNTKFGTNDIAGINAAIDKIAVTDPALANAVRGELSNVLSPVEQGQMAANYGGLSQGTFLAATPGGAARGLSAAQKSLALDITQLGLDIVGIFEPTPFADGANTLISLGRGDWFGAITSAVGIIPYVGDAAKLGKLGKWAETIAKAVDMAATNPAFRKAIEPSLRKISDAIDSVGIDRLPTQVRSQFAAIKRSADKVLQRFDVTVRGTRITLENVTTQIVNYVKRDRTQYTALRTAFDGANGARAQFAKQIATNPTYVAALRRAGLDTPEKPGAGGFWQGLVAANQAWRDGGENINLLILGDNSIDFFAFDPATSDFGRYDRVTGESLARYDTADQMVEAALSPDA